MASLMNNASYYGISIIVFGICGLFIMMILSKTGTYDKFVETLEKKSFTWFDIIFIITWVIILWPDLPVSIPQFITIFGMWGLYVMRILEITGIRDWFRNKF